MSAEHCLEIACQKLPVANRAMQEYGDKPLSAYLQNFILPPVPSYQSRDDFFDAVYRYAAPLLGEIIAEKAVRDLKNCPVILTANHLGVEYFSQSLQSSLIFSMNAVKQSFPRAGIPVFSFGNVPLNNLTYPRGALLYHVHPEKLDQMPFRLPIFPDSFKRRLAGTAPCFDRNMLTRAGLRLNKMLEGRQIHPDAGRVLKRILEKDYGADSVLSVPDYSQQAALLNTRIWKQLFAEPDAAPKLLYLEMEKIASMLLPSDLANSESLAHRVLFDAALRKEILELLDGVNGCWVQKSLAQRLLSDRPDNARQRLPESCGTVFFWGIDKLGRRIPLSIETDKNNREILGGIDDHRNRFELPFTPEDFLEYLENKRLLPSLFTCFLALSFARGLACIGGYFQGEYLPAIQKGLATALRAAGYADAAEPVSKVPTHFYLSGMLGIMAKVADQCLIPAGPVEIIAGGGITAKDMEQMCSLTLREAHLAGLFETLPDILSPEKLRAGGWKKELAADCFRLLNGKAVVK
ncbi:MAG: hypothetical protein R2941_17935 [Desulfobacterales bacterium]